MSSSSSIENSNHVCGCILIFLAKARTSSMIPTPLKPCSSKSDSNSIFDPNESAFIFVKISALSSKRSWRRSEWAEGLEGCDCEEEGGGGGARNEATPQSWRVRVCLSLERCSFMPRDWASSNSKPSLLSWCKSMVVEDWASSFWPLGLDFYSFFSFYYFVLILFMLLPKKKKKFTNIF